MYGCSYVQGNNLYDRNGTGIRNTSYNRNGNGSRTFNISQYTRLWPEHAYTFVRTRYLLRLSVCILIGNIKFSLPPNNGIQSQPQTRFITLSYQIWISKIQKHFLQDWPVLLRPPWSPLFLSSWYLLCNPNCGCVLRSQESSPWFHGDQLPIPNNKPWPDYHLTSLHLILIPNLLLMWPNDF